MKDHVQPSFEIAGRKIGAGAPCYIVAELSANHGQSIERALRLIDVARAAGVDAIKLQTYTPDTITIDHDGPGFRIGHGTLWEGKTLHGLYGEAYTPWEWHGKLFDAARAAGLHCFSTPFDDTAVDFLAKLDAPAYKIASFEIVDLPLIRRVAREKKPMIMSTGMASLAEIEEAVACARAAGARDIALLACSSAYPSPPEAIRLSRMAHLRETFHVVTGFSDHTMGTAIPAAGAALGMSILEKHICLARADGGPDAAFSLEPDELAAMVRAVRDAERAVGEAEYGPSAAEVASLAFRRSLFVVRDVKKGDLFTRDNVRSIRPSGGLHTRHIDEVVGARAAEDVKRGTPLSWKHIAGR